MPADPIDFAALDRADPLAHLRGEFSLPDGRIYLDGNSLGALPRRVPERVAQVIGEEWGEDLITSWNRHDWIGMPVRIGERIAPLVGASPGQVLCCDSTSVNLFKALAAALSLRPDRTEILTADNNFPTDLYMAQGLAALLGERGCRVRRVGQAELLDSMHDQTAVVLLTQVNFRDGELLDMAAITEAAHRAGALALWDLSHSAGVVPIALDRWHVDLAVGCGYKFLNGGPGAPAFVYVAQRHQRAASQPLTGWLGHAQPFDFSPDYQPAPGVHHFQVGTPPILSMAALECALELFDGIAVSALREKSLRLSGSFMAEIAADRRAARCSLRAKGAVGAARSH
jgi:kynureninase